MELTDEVCYTIGMGQDDIVYLAKTNFRGQERIFGIQNNNEDRFQHMYVIGQTGTGKSTLLKNIAIQDIQAGRGIALVDPHGEFAQDLLESIPPNRVSDVVYFNPSDTDFPIGFNPLEVRDEDQKHLVASGLMAIFTKIWANVWSSRMEYILNNAILALLDTPDVTLLGIPRLLVDKVYRKMIVDNIKDPVVRSFWVNEFEQYNDKFRTEAIAPIQNKVGQFLSTHLIRNIVGQTKSTLDIEDIMNSSKILIANVSKGRIGEDNSALIGAMLITKIQLTAMERVKIEKIEDRKPFMLYVDEFQNFATDSFASVLSEARKYRLGLIISHQFIGQLVSDTSTKVRDAIFGNVGTMICFRVGAPDAEFLEKQFAPDLAMEDLVNLPNHNIYLKLMIDGLSCRPFSASTLPPIAIERSVDNKEKAIEMSRKQFGRSRSEVERLINEWSGFIPGASSEPAPRPPRSAPSSGYYRNDQQQERRDTDRRAPNRGANQYPSQNNSYNNDNQYSSYDNGSSRPPFQRSASRPANPSISLKDLAGQEPMRFRKPPATPAFAPSNTRKDIEIDTDALKEILSKITVNRNSSEELEPVVTEQETDDIPYQER